MNELEREMYGDLFGESSDDDLKDLEIPEIDEGSDGDEVDSFLDTIQNGDDTNDDPEAIDSEIEELEKEFNITSAASAGAITDVQASADNDEDDLPEDADPLSPEDDDLGDKMLAATVTPEFLETALTDEEFDEFVESGDMYNASDEGYIDDSFIIEAMNCDGNGDIFMEDSAFAPAGKKFKMTRAARLKQLYEISLQIEARLHHDPMYPKMMKVYEIRRRIKGQWRKKYHALALKRATRYLKNIIKSKSSGIRKMASRLVGKKAS